MKSSNTWIKIELFIHFVKYTIHLVVSISVSMDYPLKLFFSFFQKFLPNMEIHTVLSNRLTRINCCEKQHTVAIKQSKWKDLNVYILYKIHHLKPSFHKYLASVPPCNRTLHGRKSKEHTVFVERIHLT